MNPDLDNPIGKIVNPISFGNNPSELGTLIGVALSMMFVVGALVAFVYMMWGAYNWVTSGGDKERLQKAQGRIRNAIIGVLVMVLLVTVFASLMQNVLGGRILKWGPNGMEFTIPTLRQCCTGVQCTTSRYPQCPP